MLPLTLLPRPAAASNFRPAGGAWLFILACSLFGGCSNTGSSGQTGSPDCDGGQACVCMPLYDAGTVLRVHAVEFGSDRLEAVIDEVFPSSFADANDLQPGDRVGGSAEVGPPCAHGTGPTITPGSELLVLYSAGSQRDDVNRDAALLDGSFAWTVSWTEPLVLGGSNELSQSELDVMRSPDACFEHFPALAPACNDTIDPPTGDASAATCSATPPGATTTTTPRWTLPLALLALLYAARRRPPPPILRSSCKKLRSA